MNTYYPDCPECLNESPAKASCGTCGGTGQRSMTRENLELAISAWEWAREHLQEALDDYAEMTTGNYAPNLDEITVYQNISFTFLGREDHHPQNFSMPIEWALLPAKERIEQRKQGIAARIKAEEDDRKKRAEQSRQRRMAELEKELQRLREKD